MDIDKLIGRINELAKKQKSSGLSAIESEEQQQLRKIYIDNIKGSLKSHLDTITIVDGTEERNSK